jgi:hypothetical protein
LDYGSSQAGPFLYGIGDWGPKIRTGRVIAGRPLPAPAEVPEFLLPFCAAWNYPAEPVPGEAPTAAGPTSA